MKKLSCSLAALALTLCLLPAPSLALEAEDARELLELYYVDELPQAAQEAQTLDELLSALNDPYTAYLTAEEYQDFVNSVNDSHIVGIGVSIQPHEKGILIVSVLDNSPAMEAGLIAGDIITAVDGIEVRTTEEATAHITGAEGTPVCLSVLRADGSLRSFDLVRRMVLISATVESAVSEDGNAGVILCTSFGDGTAGHFLNAIQTYDTAVNAWIIDLSANPGGTDVSAASSAGWFIGAAPVAFYRDGQGAYSYLHTMPMTPSLTEKPIIILTSPYSASAAELFSAALRDHGAAIAIGQRTFGKGIAQTILTAKTHPHLFSDDALKVTAYRFFSPAGTTNDQVGLLPTLPTTPENTYYAALLLCADEPASPAGHLKLHLADWDFFIDLETALSQEYRPAFAELLEALIPSTQLWQGHNDQWIQTSPQQVAQALSLAEYAPPTFSDLDDCTQADSVRILSVYGLVSGSGDGSFRPHDILTRAELCAMLINLLGVEASPVTKSSFYDVAPNSWYAPAIHAACHLGILPSLVDGSFHPNTNVTQQELVNILADVAARLSMYAYDMAASEPTQQDLSPFSQFSSQTRKSAWILDAAGLDLSALDPDANATRAVAADLICQLMRQTGLLWQ